MAAFSFGHRGDRASLISRRPARGREARAANRAADIVAVRDDRIAGRAPVAEFSTLGSGTTAE